MNRHKAATDTSGREKSTVPKKEMIATKNGLMKRTSRKKAVSKAKSFKTPAPRTPL